MGALHTSLARLRSSGHGGIAALCGAYLALLLAFRPATPFEWDEVQYQRALDTYDVAAHSPHPPGAPVFVAAARAVRLLVGDPQLAVQLLTSGFAAAALALAYALAIALGGSRRAAIAAAAALGVVPGFAFHANVGMTDVPAAACVLAVLLAAVRAADAPSRLPWLALVAALGVGLRPQILPAIAVAGVCALAAAVRAGRGGALAAAVAIGAGASAAIWGAAILATGPARYLAAVRHHARWMAENEAAVRLPAARLASIVKYWFVNPLGTWELAAAFWGLALAGAAALWLAGRRRAVALLLASAIPYLATGLLTFNMLSATRYVLPGLACVAVLIGSAASWRSRAARAAGLSVLVLWAAASVAWGSRVYALRREPAPVWATLEWVKAAFDRASTLVLSDGSARPHVEYVLGRAGFRIADLVPAAVAPARGPAGEAVIALTRLPIPGWEVAFFRDWGSRRVLQLAFWRYGSFTAQRPPGADAASPMFSPAWQIEGDTYVLWGLGQVRLPDGAPPAAARVCPLNAAVTVVSAAGGAETVGQGACRDIPLRPGSGGGMFVLAPPSLHAVLAPVTFAPAGAGGGGASAAGEAAEYLRLLAEHDAALGASAAGGAAPRPQASSADPAAPAPSAPPLYVLPVARAAGFLGAQWRTELVLANPTAEETAVIVELLAAGQDNRTPRRSVVTLAPGESRRFADALGELFGASGAAALRVSRDDAAVTVRSRTFDSASRAPRGRLLPGIEAGAAYGPGRPARLAGLAHDPATATRTRTNLGVLNVTGVSLDVDIAVADEGGAALGTHRIALPPFGFVQVDDLFAVAGAAAPARGRARVSTPAPEGAFLAYAAVVRRDPPSVTYVRPQAPAPAPEAAAPPPTTPAAPSSATAPPAGGSAPPSLRRPESPPDRTAPSPAA
jgi:4-amino-4-deoxy-L-arabinose transferase-like glycosyltransferase